MTAETRSSQIKTGIVSDVCYVYGNKGAVVSFSVPNEIINLKNPENCIDIHAAYENSSGPVEGAMLFINTNESMRTMAAIFRDIADDLEKMASIRIQ